MLETQAYFENIKQVIAEHLEAAERSIFVAVAWFTDKDLYDILCRKARAGLSVRVVIVDDDINNNTAYGIDKQALTQRGGKIYQVSDALMHHKFCIIDEYVVISGSYNWTYKAANENIENITVTQGDKAFATQFTKQFHHIIEQHFGEKGQVYADAPPDIAKIAKRLEVILKLIELEDTEDLDEQCHRLQRGVLTTEVEEIIQLLQRANYGEAVAKIQAFVQKHQQLTTYIDPRIAALRLEIKLLQIELTALANEESELLKQIREFSIRFNNEIGELMQEVLHWRRIIAKEKATENTEKQAEYEEAERDYEEYSKHHEELKEEPLAALDKAQMAELKRNFRKAAMFCHPDKVHETLQAQATAAYLELQKAYESNDLQRVNTILAELQKGNFATRSEEINQVQHLEYEVIRLRKRMEETLSGMEAMKKTDTWQTLNIESDWDAYFENIKPTLQAELEKLKEEYGK